MSVAKPHSPVARPAFESLVADVTPPIVSHLTIPSMRSLAQTSKSWNTYLKKEWDLSQHLFRHAVMRVHNSSKPVVRALNVASKLIEVHGIGAVERFYDAASTQCDMPRKKTFFTLLRPRVKSSYCFQVPSSLSGISRKNAWECNEVERRKINGFLVECVTGVVAQKDSEGDADRSRDLVRQVFKPCLNILTKLRSGPRTFAFIALTELLAERQFHGDEKKRFWSAKKGIAADFSAVAEKLLPRDLHMRWVESYEHGRNPFLVAVNFCLANMPGEANGLRGRLLDIAINLIKSYPGGKRYWKKIMHDTQTLKPHFLRDLLNAVYGVGNVSQSFKDHCKTRLIECGFIKRGKEQVLEAQPLPFT